MLYPQHLVVCVRTWRSRASISFCFDRSKMCQSSSFNAPLAASVDHRYKNPLTAPGFSHRFLRRILHQSLHINPHSFIHSLSFSIIMLSFSKIITFAAVAFGTLSQAVPLSPRDASIEARNTGSGLIEGVLTGVLATVTVKLEPILCLVPGNATVENIKPILEDVYVIISGAVGAVDKLADKPVEEVVGAIVVDDVVKLVCDILGVVFRALAIALNLVGRTGILQIVIGVVDITFAFVKVIVEVTGGFGGVLLFKLQGYVAIGAVVDVLSLLNVASPL
ncbi:hypothetical protein EDB83DRAFT_143162 [Lactarius deliciosus]|nr:hypothetical protein EDB83DRAFT_143162 [Lactarius deliciosus]